MRILIFYFLAGSVSILLVENVSETCSCDMITRQNDRTLEGGKKLSSEKVREQKPIHSLCLKIIFNHLRR